MSPLGQCVLLGDIGATNARFALVESGSLGTVQNFKVAKYRQFTDVLERVLAKAVGGRGPRVQRAFFAVAGPVNGSRLKLTNTSWVIDTRELQNEFALQVEMVNDFAALAYSLPWLSTKDLSQIGNGDPDTSAPIAVVGPGSGLGVACLVPGADKPVVLASEGGHATLAGACEREDQILAHLRDRFGHVSAERAISGPGLENIFQAISVIDGHGEPAAAAAEITINALEDKSQRAREALSLFCAFLGSFAGNVALTFGAHGGVYIGGGISPRILNFLSQSDFRKRFESKGRFRDYLKDIPTYVITHPAATLVGLKSFLAPQGEKPSPRRAREASC
jgi:glucokinase